jgi:hypothetical protein
LLATMGRATVATGTAAAGEAAALGGGAEATETAAALEALFDAPGEAPVALVCDCDLLPRACGAEFPWLAVPLPSPAPDWPAPPPPCSRCPLPRSP